MLLVAEREKLVVHQTAVDTDDGRLEIWVDGLLNWKAGVMASESLTGQEILDEQALSWSQGIQQILSHQQRREALEAIEHHVADTLRELNDVFSDTTDPMSDAWIEAASTLRHLYCGLVTYYIDEADLFVEGVFEAMPAFVGTPSVKVCGGLREFVLTTTAAEEDMIIWTEKPDPGRPIFEPEKYPPSIELAEMLDVATRGETRQLLELHLFGIVQAASHIRFVMNKLRAGVPITLNEQVRLRGYAFTITNFQRQFQIAT